MYHANLFPLIRHEPLPVYFYEASIEPLPANRPQLYQILGIISKQMMFLEKQPIVPSGQQIMALGAAISKLAGYVVDIPEVGKFNVDIKNVSKSDVNLDQFDQYKLLVNRLADIALTILSPEYYKFHPDAPYILRDEPYFDAELIEKTGIIDSKKYYRGLHIFNGQPVFALNRETQLRSNRNLLNELKSLKKQYESMRKLELDFYNPPKEFVDYINYLIRGKAAEVLRYPGPSVREIKEITWAYRAKDTTPGSTKSHITYLHDTYGIGNLDPNQPLVAYEVGIGGNKRIQYHVPEVLSVGHTFHDLEKRIPYWQRTQVWGIIHPDCKNQFQKIHDVLFKIDETLRAHLPEVYPKSVEFSTKALDIESFVSQPAGLKLQFGNCEMPLKSPYDVEFYRRYTGKKVIFARPIENVKALVCVKKQSASVKAFLAALAKEFKLRNNSDLIIDYGVLDVEETHYSGYQAIITIGEDAEEQEETYRECKEKIQNTLGIVHQHIRKEHVNEDSVMQLVMELSIKLGGDPWLLPERKDIPCVVGIHSYMNPLSERQAIFAIAQSGTGALIKQFDPTVPGDFEKLGGALAELNKEKHRVLYLHSFDRFGAIEKLKGILKRVEKIEYCIVEIEDQDYLRFFETWIPKRVPRFGKAVVEIVKSSVEAYERAPQGAALKSDDGTFFLLTGKTIEKETIKRGCPLPIKLNVKEKRGDDWSTEEISEYVLALCMMGRASGHMTRFPAPLYYLQSYAHYYNNFGVPKDGNIRQRVFYI
jgi:hypothetical protein